MQFVQIWNKQQQTSSVCNEMWCSPVICRAMLGKISYKIWLDCLAPQSLSLCQISFNGWHAWYTLTWNFPKGIMDECIYFSYFYPWLVHEHVQLFIAVLGLYLTSTPATTWATLEKITTKQSFHAILMVKLRNHLFILRKPHP